MEPKRDPLWDHISPHKILDTKEQEAQWWERQREEQMRERMRLRLRLDPGNFQSAPSPWTRETTPPLHRRSQMPDPDPFGLRWLAESMVRHHLESPSDPSQRDHCPKVPWIPDPSYSPLQTAWLEREMESICSKRGRPMQLVRVDSYDPPTPTPGELLAASMSRLPALPPTAGGLMPPQKA